MLKYCGLCEIGWYGAKYLDITQYVILHLKKSFYTSKKSFHSLSSTHPHRNSCKLKTSLKQQVIARMIPISTYSKLPRSLHGMT